MSATNDSVYVSYVYFRKKGLSGFSPLAHVYTKSYNCFRDKGVENTCSQDTLVLFFSIQLPDHLSSVYRCSSASMFMLIQHFRTSPYFSPRPCNIAYDKLFHLFFLNKCFMSHMVATWSRKYVSTPAHQYDHASYKRVYITVNVSHQPMVCQ